MSPSKTKENQKKKNQTVSILAGNRARIFYSPQKLKLFRPNRDNYDLNLKKVDVDESQERKKEKIFKHLEKSKILRAKNNLLRFSKKIRVENKNSV